MQSVQSLYKESLYQTRPDQTALERLQNESVFASRRLEIELENWVSVEQKLVVEEVRLWRLNVIWRLYVCSSTVILGVCDLVRLL
jgi:hypothetical protein